MKKLTITLLFFSWVVKGQDLHDKKDSIKVLDEVLIMNNIKKKN